MMISLDTVKLALRLDLDATTYDDLLTYLVAQALADVELRTGRYFGEEEERFEVVKGLGTRSLWLSDVPVEFSEIDVSEQAYAGATQATLVEDTDFELRTNGGAAWLERRGGGCWRNGYEYVVTYSRGYEAGGLPASIENLVLSLVRAKFSGIGLDGVKSETLGDYSYTKATDSELASIAGAEETIALWRGPVIA